MRVSAKTVFSMAVAAALLTGLAGHTARAADNIKIKKSPAFTAKQLMAEPTSQWVTNGGTVYNQRYSPLDQINKDNVAGLKAIWTAKMGSGNDAGQLRRGPDPRI